MIIKDGLSFLYLSSTPPTSSLSHCSFSRQRDLVSFNNFKKLTKGIQRIIDEKPFR